MNDSLSSKVNVLSRVKHELEKQNKQLEDARTELRFQNVTLVQKSIDLSDLMRVLEDKNYDLEQSRAELEKTLAAYQKSREELRVAKEAAEAATRIKSEFLANMSHEIRTPMNGVIGMINLLLEAEPTDEQRELAETARISAESLMSIINDILDFSKVEAGRLDLEPVPFDLFIVAEEVLDLLSIEASKRDIDVRMRYAPDTPRHFVNDPGRIRQVLVNLMSNAIKFTLKGHVILDIRAEVAAKDEIHVIVTVDDSGIGIPEDKLKSIFEQFSQADMSATRKFGGAGLGLTISRHLVELMGGDIRATSRVGVGSTFTVTLPMLLDWSAEQNAARLNAGSIHDGKTEAAECLSGRILVVEDNVVNQKVAVRMLEKMGCRVDVAANGLEALDILARCPYDLVFMDLHMPEMDGLTATIEIRRQECGDYRIPIVAMTADAMTGDREKCLDAGMDDYITKPVRKSDVQAALRNWIRPDQINKRAVLHSR